MITFDSYSKNHFAEHTRRKQELRRAAKSVQWTYPLFLIVFFTFPILACVQALRIAYSYEVIKISEILPHETFLEAMPFLYILSALIALIALVVGFLWGSAKARYYRFEAESLDLKTRQEYHLLCISKFMDSVGQTRAPRAENDTFSHIVIGADGDEHEINI